MPRTPLNEQLLISAPPMPPAQDLSFSHTQDPTLWSYWQILVKHKMIILVSILVVTALAAIVTVRMTPLYESIGRIAIASRESDILGFKSEKPSDAVDWERSEIETQVRILQSDDLQLQVIRKLGLGMKPRPVAQSSIPAPTAPPQSDDLNDAEALANLRRGLLVQSVARTRIIEIRYTSPDPRLAANVVNTLIESYIERNVRSHFETTTQVSQWLSRRLGDLQIKVETSQAKLVEYQKQYGIVGLDDKQNTTTVRLDQLNRELTEAEGERVRKEADYHVALSSDPEMIVQLSPNPSGPRAVLDKLRAQEADLKTQYAQLTTEFGLSYPKVAEVNAQLKQVQQNIQLTMKRLAERMHSEYQAAVRREKMLRSLLEQQKQEANRLNQNAIEYNILKRDADASRQLYEGLLQKLKEAEVSAGLQSTDTRVVDQARVPTSPARPKKGQNIALGFCWV